MEISELQDVLRRTYLERDARRGPDATFRWLTEEVGELARALRKQDRENLEHEFGDVLAWLTSLASLTGVELSTRRGCFRMSLETASWRDRTHAFYEREGWIDYGTWFIKVLDPDWKPHRAAQ
jgi:NTP pyrophosphatase (non-canonical NTP hydrolase)